MGCCESVYLLNTFSYNFISGNFNVKKLKVLVGTEIRILILHQLSNGWVFVLCLKVFLVMKIVSFFFQEIKSTQKCYIKNESTFLLSHSSDH